MPPFAPCTTRFAYRGVTIDARCSDRADMTWLAEFLTPAFQITVDGVADCTVTLVRDDRRYQECLDLGQQRDGHALVGFALDHGPVHLPLWSAAEQQRILFDREQGALYIVNDQRSEVVVLSATHGVSSRTAFMKVVREFAMTAAWTCDSLVLHAAVLAVGDQGIIIAGRKNAGKTSLLMHCLRTVGARFVSNDRAVVDLRPASPMVHGMPTIVSIRAHAWTLHPELAERQSAHGFSFLRTMAEAPPRRAGAAAARRAGGADSLSPAQVCRLLGVEMADQVGASALLFPRITAAVDTIALRELSNLEARERLNDALFAATSVRRTSEVFRAGASNPEMAPETVRRLWDALTSRLRVFECDMGPGAYRSESASVLFEQVLGV